MSYFTDALSSFTTEVAYRESIRHLYDKGLSTSEIIENCMYPVTAEMVEKEIKNYQIKKSQPKSTYVEDVDKYGRKTLRKVFEK